MLGSKDWSDKSRGFVNCTVKLDRLFENVCELDLIFNFETLHAVLGEMIVGGVVIETALDKYVYNLSSRAQC